MKNLITKFITILSLVGIVSTSLACQHTDCDDHDCMETRNEMMLSPSKGSSGHWLEKDFPKKDWVCTEVSDLGSQSKKCEMCLREWIRYEHSMYHEDTGKDLKVGCICAGHMEGDVGLSQTRENILKNRVIRRENWLNLNWKISQKGNPYLRTRANGEGGAHHIVLVKSRFNHYSPIVDKTRLNSWYQNINDAKYAAFDHLYPSHMQID